MPNQLGADSTWQIPQLCSSLLGGNSRPILQIPSEGPPAHWRTFHWRFSHPCFTVPTSWDHLPNQPWLLTPCCWGWLLEDPKLWQYRVRAGFWLTKWLPICQIQLCCFELHHPQSSFSGGSNDLFFSVQIVVSLDFHHLLCVNTFVQFRVTLPCHSAWWSTFKDSSF